MSVVPGSLFRPESVAARDAGLSHCGSHPLPLCHRVLSLLAVLFVVLVAALLYHGKYAARHAVRGVVTTTQANVRVVASQPGTVTGVFIDEATPVQRGAPLLRIENSRYSADRDVNEALLDSLQTELAAMDTEMQHSRAQAGNDGRAAARGLQNMDLQLAALHRELQLARSQRKFSEMQHRRLLAAGSAVAAQDAEHAAALLLAAESRVSAIQRQLLQQRAARVELQVLRENVAERLAAQMASMESRKERVRQQLLTVKSASDITVLAPVAGRSSGILVRQGEFVTAGQPLLTLLPESADFVVDLLVPDRAAGLLTRGADVRLRFDAFPHQHYGLVRGRVSSVSASTVFAADKPAAAMQAARGFLVRVELLQANGSPVLPLRAGMAVTADILQNERRLLDWLVAPLRGATAGLRQ